MVLSFWRNSKENVFAAVWVNKLLKLMEEN